MDYLSLQIRIPNSFPIESKNELNQWINTIEQDTVDIYDGVNETKYYFIIKDVNLATYIEDTLDNYIQQKIQYNLIIYDKESKHPSSIRINKRGKKIFTKKQTKILGI
jgi:hypothetical protein